MGLSTISRGSPTEKLQWTFNLYDINGDGCITREEMQEIISSIYSLLGRFTEPMVSEEATREHADKVFDVCITINVIMIKSSLYLKLFPIFLNINIKLKYQFKNE